MQFLNRTFMIVFVKIVSIFFFLLKAGLLFSD